MDARGTLTRLASDSSALHRRRDALLTVDGPLVRVPKALGLLLIEEVPLEVGTDQAVLTGIEKEQAPSQALLAVAVVVLPGGQQRPS